MDAASSDERLDRLERLVERLAAEVHDLRLKTAAGEGRSVRLPTPASTITTRTIPLSPSGEPFASTGGPRTDSENVRLSDDVSDIAADGRWSTVDGARRTAGDIFTIDNIERLIGRYGMLALATITGLAAVGTFIGWAASRAQIGPEARLLLGVLLAMVLAATGMRIRPRERSFGAVMLGLALAVVHVCAWGAGPAVLGIVPAELTLVLVLLSSSALAVFAHRENDQPLWCVGFGGAAIAPFVTAGDRGSALALTLYGGAVMLLGCWALRGREWRIAGRVLTLAGFTYTVSLIAIPDETGAPLMALGLATLIAGAGVIPFTGLAMRRGRLRGFGVTAALAAFDISNFAPSGVALPGLIGMIAAAILWVVYVDITAELPAGSLLDGLLGEGNAIWDFVDAVLIPLVFLGAILDAVPGPDWHDGLAAAGLAAIMFVFALRRPVAPLRNAAVLTVCIASLVAAWWLGAKTKEWRTALLAIPALGFLLARTRLPARPWMPAAAFTLATCSIAAFAALERRSAYAYRPFGTEESLIALVVAGAWVASMLIARDRRNLLQTAAWIWMFAWVHQELYEAFNPTASTLLIISYYAASSVVLVGAGRTMAEPMLRHIGLLMALVAAGAAVRGAAKLDTVWAEIAGYLVTSVFLLALAWWYRQREDESETGLGGAGERS